MTMLGLGSFPAADVTSFQMFHGQSFQGRGQNSQQRSVSPWTQESAAEYCQVLNIQQDVFTFLLFNKTYFKTFLFFFV